MSWRYDPHPTALQYFASLVDTDDQLPLMEAAISIAQDAEPQLDLQEVGAELDRLQVRLSQRLAGLSDPLDKLRILNQFFYGELGFAGNLNNYYDPANSYVHHVLQTRRGIAISVALIWLELAQGIGLSAQGVSFPGHFLIKVGMPQGQVVMDPLSGETFSADRLAERLEPFWQQAGMSGEDAAPLGLYLQAAQPRDILERMLRNLQEIHRSQGDWAMLVAVLDRLVQLQPQDWRHVRDRGWAWAQWGDGERAASDLQRCLALNPQADVLQLQQAIAQLHSGSTD